MISKSNVWRWAKITALLVLVVMLILFRRSITSGIGGGVSLLFGPTRSPSTAGVQALAHPTPSATLGSSLQIDPASVQIKHTTALVVSCSPLVISNQEGGRINLLIPDSVKLQCDQNVGHTMRIQYLEQSDTRMLVGITRAQPWDGSLGGILGSAQSKKK